MSPFAGERVDRWLMNTYRRLPVQFVRGSGMHLFDQNGREYLDFVAGISVMALGHAHPAVNRAISDQAAKLVHTSSLYYTEQQGLLAERLCRLLGWPDGRVFFANSGAEANECALKLIRKWSNLHLKVKRPLTVTALNSFHGRTFETLAATGQPEKWAPFLPLPEHFVHVAYGDLAALQAALTEEVAAVLLEPVQAEGGIIQPPQGYLEEVSQLCQQQGVPLVFDEVQTGLGRTGSWFCFQQTGADPALVTVAKALGGGLPIGACVARGQWASVFEPGDHATTMGGGPLVCAAALAVLDTIERDDLVTNVRKTGEVLRSELEKLHGEHPQTVKQVRGSGFLLGIELREPVAGDVALAALHDGLLVNAVTPSVLRLTPPLIATPQQCEQAVSVLHQVLARRRIGRR